MIPYLDDIDPLASNIGAVNTLVRTERAIKATIPICRDCTGPQSAGRRQSQGTESADLGAGGVARAVLRCCWMGAKEAIILNRTVEKAQSIADEVNHLTGKKRKFAKALSIDAYDTPEGERYLAIQATSVGMYPD